MLSVIFLSMLACGLPGATPTPSTSGLETSIAATLTALFTPESPAEFTKTPSPTTTAPIVSTTSILRITYTDDGNVFLVEDTGPPRQLTTSGGAEQVLISSDGMKVAFTRRLPSNGNAEIRSVNTDGTGETTLLSHTELDALYPLGSFLHHDVSQITFIPGTHDLIFNTRSIPEGPGLIKNDDLLMLNTDAGTLSKILPPDAGGDFSLSPDGTQVALVKPSTISLANIDGTNLRPDLISYSPVMTYSEFQYYAQPVWSPDGTMVSVAIPSPDPFAPTTTATIWRFSSDGSSVLNLGTTAGNFYFSQAFGSASISPDLNHLAFLRETSTPNVQELWLANADGTGETLYSTGDLQWLGWAPDSLHFAFSLGDPTNIQLGRSGFAPIPLCGGIQFRWIDSRKYLCAVGSIGAWTLTLGEIDGSLTPLVSPAGDFISFDFTQ
jgi:hypothetical protein